MKTINLHYDDTTGTSDFLAAEQAKKDWDFVNLSDETDFDFQFGNEAYWNEWRLILRNNKNKFELYAYYTINNKSHVQLFDDYGNADSFPIKFVIERQLDELLPF